MKLSFPRALGIFSVFFSLNASVVSAVEKVQVSPPSLSMKKGERKNLTLTGKNLSAAKSAVVFLKNSPKNQFTAKVTCMRATRCVVSLTLKAQVAAGGYSVKLFDAKKQPVAEGQFKLTPPSGKTVPKSGQALRSKPRQAPQAGKTIPRSSQSLRAKPKRTPPSVAKAVPVPRRGLKPRPKQSPPTSKTIPRSSRDLRPKPRQAPQVGKLLPRSGQSLRAKPGQSPQATKIRPRPGRDSEPKLKQVPLAGKAIPKSSRDLRSKPKQVPLKSTKSLIPGRIREKPSGLAELAGITLASGKRGFGELVKGTVTLKEKAPAPKGVMVALSSNNRKIATVSPVLQIPPGESKADFNLKTGQNPGVVKISAKLGKVTLITSLVVEAPKTGNINSKAREITGRRGEPAETTPGMISFKPVTINPGKIQVTGRRPIPFKPVIINPGKIQVTGRRPIPFKPVIINPGKIQVTGRRPIPFKPVIINPGKMQVTGRRGERAQIR